MLYIRDLCNIVNQPYLKKKEKECGSRHDFKWFQLYLDTVCLAVTAEPRRIPQWLPSSTPPIHSLQFTRSSCTWSVIQPTKPWWKPGKTAALCLALHGNLRPGYHPGDPAGLEQDLGVQNIHGDFIVHLRIRITELKEKLKSLKPLLPQSAEQLALSHAVVEAHGCIYIHTPLADEGLLSQEESNFLTVT